MIRPRRGWRVVLVGLLLLAGCSHEKPYGVEARLRLPAGSGREVWAVAPAIDLSGENLIDPLLQGDSLFRELQTVLGLTALPVNRAAQVYAALGIRQVQSQADADLVLSNLGATGLVVPTITLYDPYDPPKVGATLTLFRRSAKLQPPARSDATPREQARDALPPPGSTLPVNFAPGTVQATGVFDAANGSVRVALAEYADGRYDPRGPAAEREYLLDVDRYTGWVYYELLHDLVKNWRDATKAAK